MNADPFSKIDKNYLRTEIVGFEKAKEVRSHDILM